jgi:hypothetical protein
MSQQDNLQAIGDCLKAQINAAKDELERLNKENRDLMVRLGELPEVLVSCAVYFVEV